MPEGEARSGSRFVGKRRLRLSTWLSLALLVLIWAGTLTHLRLDESSTIRAAGEKERNIARIFGGHVSAVIKDIDKNLLFLRHAWESDPADFDLPAWTTNRYLLRDVTIQMAMIGADGRLVSTNVQRDAPPIDLSDREHFRVHRDRTADELFISAPIFGRTTGKWTIQLTRRMADPDGRFAGVLVASLDPYYLSRFFEQIDLGGEGAITLIGLDGLIRARGGLNPSMLGRSIVGTSLYDELTRNESGLRRAEGTMSPGRRIFAFERLKDFPLTVTVGMAESEVLAGHMEKRRVFLIAAGGLSVLVLVVMVIGIGHERRLDQAWLAQARSEARVTSKSLELEAILARTDQGIVMVAADGLLRVVNRRAAELLGDDADLVVGRPLSAVHQALLGIGADAAGPRSIEVGPRSLELVVTAMPDGGRLYTVADITVHRRAETVLAEARDRAEAAIRTRTAFLATVSHELRTPLNGVVGATRLLEDCDDPRERALWVATMRSSAEHLLQIIDDILDFTRLEADRMVFEARPFDLDPVIAGVCEIVRPRAAEKGLELTVETAAELPCRFVGDAGRIRQVLFNLVGNAVKFTETGSVRVRVDGEPPLGEGGAPTLRFDVEDTGIGIAPEHVGDLFVEFSQLDGSITRRFGGTGLGLAISREIVRRMGGEITVASRLGEGSVFTVRLPLAVAAAPEAAPAPVADDVGPGLEILLAEDNPTNTLVATRLLARLGHRVATAVDGVAALAALAERRFDVVLMDVMMPRMDGLTAIRKIRAGETPEPGVPIVALTANALAEDREAALAAGADAFATKPVSAEKLAAAITEARVRSASSTRSAA